MIDSDRDRIFQDLGFIFKNVKEAKRERDNEVGRTTKISNDSPRFFFFSKPSAEETN